MYSDTKAAGILKSTLLACCFLLIVVGSAQAATFAELGAQIKQFTDRSSSGLVPQTTTDGSVLIDLQGRFQHAMLLQVGDDNLPLSACVSNIQQANAFFGRNLLTGAALAPDADKTHKELMEAARLHGMSPAEYQFFGDLIENGLPDLSRKGDPALFSSVFNFSYTDGATEGFNSTAAPILPAPNNDTAANLGLQRQTLLVVAGLIWDGVLDTAVDINVTASFDPLSCTPPSPGVPGGATGGRAGPMSVVGLNVNSDPTTIYPIALANKLVGADIDTEAADIFAQFNSSIDDNCLLNGVRFYYGLDNAQPAGTINLFLIMLHELGHGLGFTSFTDDATGEFLLGFQDIWARYLYDRTQDKTWDEMTNPQRVASAINNNNVFWDGDNVRIASDFLGANGRDVATGRVQMYTPSPIEPGSSVSHFSTNASPNLLMEPALTPGLPTTLDLTRQLMRDIGWYRDGDTDGVPESITNVLPSGGHLENGSQQSVSWNNSGGFNRNVTIELSVDGGITFPYTVAEDVANSGSELVSVPFVTTSQGRFRVREHDYVTPMGVSAANITINSNSPPSFAPGPAVLRQQASGPGSEPAVLGTVNDIQTSAMNLNVTRVADGTATGITVGSIGIAANGVVFAPLSASCTATSGTVRFEVSDGELTGNGDLQLNVSPNASPSLGTYANTSLGFGEGTLLSPTSPPTDNGSISSFTATILPATFTGNLVTDQATGNITVSNASPEGTYTITATVTDDCGSSTVREIQVEVIGDGIFDDGFEVTAQ